MIGDYCADNNFLVYRICITCDNMPELDISVLDTPMRHIMPFMSSMPYCADNKTLYIFVPHVAYDYMHFTYTCNFSCEFLRYGLYPSETFVFYTCNLSCILIFGYTSHVNKTDQQCYIYILCVHVVLFVSSTFS